MKANWQCGECRTAVNVKVENSETISGIMWDLKKSHGNLSPRCLNDPDPDEIRVSLSK